MVCLRVFTSCDAHCVPCRRPKTFLHGPGAAVGIAIFNSIGAIGTSHMSYAAETGKKDLLVLLIQYMLSWAAFNMDRQASMAE